MIRFISCETPHLYAHNPRKLAPAGSSFPLRGADISVQMPLSASQIHCSRNGSRINPKLDS